ncbi:EthD domain-containing protein [Acrodontium crateriforme]|uniref:EthD domain-containing protein n=1 Tax=Acrodontium crateriforme TaxID=150365 RepID=A0AAQ3M4X0_9PEZI|nr:EthD domain-containing protein [Acrodontium crateriforme]
MGKSQHLFAVTISAKRKPGMDEDAYHKYISETHAGHLKTLLVEKKIVDYTMQHNTAACMGQIDQLFPNLPSVNHTTYDAFVTIVFRDIEDYISVKNDPHYLKVVNPDHANFADPSGTMMGFGWFERHVADGQLVEE